MTGDGDYWPRPSARPAAGPAQVPAELSLRGDSRPPGPEATLVDLVHTFLGNQLVVGSLSGEALGGLGLPMAAELGLAVAGIDSGGAWSLTDAGGELASSWAAPPPMLGAVQDLVGLVSLVRGPLPEAVVSRMEVVLGPVLDAVVEANGDVEPSEVPWADPVEPEDEE